jgi:hypothetical protein
MRRAASTSKHSRKHAGRRFAPLPRRLIAPIVFAVAALSCAQGVVVEESGSTSDTTRSPSTYEETQTLVGEDLIQALGLKPLELPKEPISNTDPRLGPCAVDPSDNDHVGGIVDTGTAVYCFAGIVSSRFEAWDLAQRIMGHVPCDLEKQAFRLLEKADAAFEAGDRDAGITLSSAGHELNVRAQTEC